MWLCLYGEREASFALGTPAKLEAFSPKEDGNLDAMTGRLVGLLKDKTLEGVAAFGGPGRLALVRGLLAYAAGLARARSIPSYGFTARDLLLAGWAPGADTLVFEPVRGTLLAYSMTKKGTVARRSLQPSVAPSWGAKKAVAVSPAAQSQQGFQGPAWPDQGAVRMLEILPNLLALPPKNRFPTHAIEYARPAV